MHVRRRAVNARVNLVIPRFPSHPSSSRAAVLPGNTPCERNGEQLLNHRAEPPKAILRTTDDHRGRCRKLGQNIDEEPDFSPD
ncbi:hypothetical protein AVEN_146080-1 [Araneus ventricosus]|uniref:Uncharacterized protein n=1 Tax=Araneus ventricosus TaxID=182803 RepID=A0A4Y2S0C5_ARAVE|nr:hypothetical protein AVEN_146080-1 [Araneus ventricosus]